MGQYFALVNLDKKQYVHAHAIGNGLKFGEQTGWKYSTEVVAAHLVGEPDDRHPLIGSWRGDGRVGFVGDEGDARPIDGVSLDDVLMDEAEKIYGERDTPNGCTDISAQVREMMSAIYGITYEGDGWLSIKEPDGLEVNPFLRPDLVVRAK